ncbi:hypothetical protein AB0G48_20830 [Streptomyces rubiginosohelvolus]|uniref:hypothetical protein n=1 Tax=Streptomyces rubiginosohelvolus TaxID=67362 RepID=UPI0033DCFCA7
MPQPTDEVSRPYAAAMALQWAEEAEQHARAAQATQDKLDESQRNSSSWGRQLTNDYRNDHARHATRVTEAVRMAEMWARVAAVHEPEYVEELATPSP